MRAFTSVVAAVTLGLFTLAPQAFAQDKGTVGISMPTKSSARWIADGDNMARYFKEKGYQTDLQYAEDEIPNQLAQIENMLTKGAKVLVIAAIDGTTLSDVLAQAASQGTKIIAYDRLIRGSGNVDYYATFDNFQVGVLQGGYIVDKLGLKEGKGPFNIELFGGSPDDNNAFFFYNGAMSVLDPYIKSGKLVVRSGQLDVGPGQGEAAFVGALELAVLALGQRDHGVADHPGVPDVVVVGAVVDEDGEVDAHLGGGEPHALGGVHRGEHVGHEGAQLLVELGDRSGARVHDGRAPPGDGQHGAACGAVGGCHGVTLLPWPRHQHDA